MEILYLKEIFIDHTTLNYRFVKQFPDYSTVSRMCRRVLALCVLCASLAVAQISERISSVTIAGAVATGAPLTVQANLVHPDIIDHIDLAYRHFGENSYRRIEMVVNGNAAVADIPATSVAPPFVEYYFILTIRNIAVPETYPLENAEQQPLKATVEDLSAGTGGLVLLSPEKNEKLLPSDVLISFSLINFDSTLDRSSIKTYIDNRDISSFAVLSGDLVVVRPENISPNLDNGSHTLRIELYDTQHQLLQKSVTKFSVASFEEGMRAAAPSQILYNASAQLETRNENISNVVTPYNRATLSAGAQYDQFRVHGNAYITNEEQSDRQPQDRFFIGAESPWLNVGYGDSYPTFPDLVMNGRRVRGLTGNLTLGGFNLDVSQGEIVRNIEGDTIKTFGADSLAAEQQRNPTGTFVFDPATQRWVELQSPGTFSRGLLVIRPSFGKRDESHIGFTYLKSKDDINSIHYGTKPEENLVLGSDMLLVFDNRRFEVTGQAAISATNTDITNGTFSDSQIDSLFNNYSESSRNTIKTIRDIVSKFITVNQNLIPLNAKNFPTLSYEGNVLLNYFNNNFRLSYLRHGESYESFGQSFLQTDVAGFNVSDRIGLVQNQVFLSGGVERLNDNTAETKPTTTAATTINVGISYYPLIDAPNITLAYLRASNVNDLPLTDSAYAIDDQTDRILVQIGKEFLVLGARHDASISVSTSTRDDHTYHNLGTHNTAITLSNTTQFTIPLQTILSLSFNSSKFVTADTSSSGNEIPTTLSYTTINASAQYRMLESRLLLNGLVSPTFGDIERVLVDANVQYYFMKNISVQTQMSLYFNSKLFNVTPVTNDVVWSIILRADI